MAQQINITLQAGEVSSTDVRLYTPPGITPPVKIIDIIIYAGDATPTNIVLRPPLSNIYASLGIFTWSGVVAQVPVQLLGVPGSYTWAGTASQVPIQISATSGSYTWSGTTSFVPLLVNTTTGTYSWIGTTSDIITTTVIIETPGTYNWVGTISQVPVQLQATVGTYSWTGTQAVWVVWPDPSTVKLGVVYGPNMNDYTGTYVDNGIKYDIATGQLVKPLSSSVVMTL